mmetsp:Transcript_16920/g.24824  ORF Transcript_16920/g.24824 Transcript_16920/m.24824 type:complete len:254 (+) Transcript_16920:24-785(+)|eukprot:CAMPEP_0195509376 /NCGR_PEP_ID=MMETSP0794_2-20130614/2328_1 /TAXON_ID=515487 /ORGANISM="Stephanopyxis turris, Strain CCMP 815" /LENGTH=253 /DNA_ID=CAMNT_0040636575 /DNA_START=23 /DNA_END=784 /DNA_ORIENTATION=-
MATIAVIGAGGPTGLECIRVLSSRGKLCRAIVREPSKYAEKFSSFPNVTVEKGDVTDPTSMKTAFGSVQKVVFAASASSYSGEGGPESVDHKGIINVIAAAKEVGGIDQIVLVSSRLVNPVNKWHPIRIILNNFKYSLMDEKFKGEEALRASKDENFSYTIVRPGGLTGGEGQKRQASHEPGAQYVVAVGAEGDCGASSSIHRNDVARVVFEALENKKAKGKTVEIVSRPKKEGDPEFKDRMKSIFDEILEDK